MEELIPLGIFQSLLILLICDDPTNLDPTQRENLEDWLNEQSVKRGFTDWIDAFQEVP